MARGSVIQHPKSGNDAGHFLQHGKPPSSESSASEKAEDTGGRQGVYPHNVMRSLNGQRSLIQAVDDTSLDYDSSYDHPCTSNFEFQKGDRGGSKPSVAPYLNKGAPSKWDDAEKWLVSPSSGEACGKAKTKSGPLHGHYGHGGLHVHPVKVIPSNQHDWHGHPHSMKSGGCPSELPQESGPEELIDVSSQHHDAIVKLPPVSHSDQNFAIAGEWTRSMDAVKGPEMGHAVAPNFAFAPTPSGSTLGCSPLADETLDMKDVCVSREGNYIKSYLKPFSRTRKPTADSIVPIPAVPPYTSPAPAVRSISMRDMGTEMTPIASQEPSRTGTPIRATTPTLQSPVSSCSSSPRRGTPRASPVEASGSVSASDNAGMPMEVGERTEGRRDVQGPGPHMGGKVSVVAWASKEEEDADASKSLKNIDLEEVKRNVLETRAAAWEEAEQSKYLARFKRDEAKIIAWENHQKAKADAELRRTEVKVEKLRMHAHEKLMKKLTAVRRKAEEQRAAAEARRSEQASRTAHQAEYIRQTGRLPASFFSCSFCG